MLLCKLGLIGLNDSEVFPLFFVFVTSVYAAPYSMSSFLAFVIILLSPVRLFEGTPPSV